MKKKIKPSTPVKTAKEPKLVIDLSGGGLRITIRKCETDGTVSEKPATVADAIAFLRV